MGYYNEPGWTIDKVAKETMAKCPTCKKLVPGAVDGLIRHMTKDHGAKMPKIRKEKR